MRELARSEGVAVHVSNVANVVLFIAKIYASFESKSLAVIASTLDSLLDMLSGLVLWFAAHAMKKPNQYSYPIGKGRMQPVVSLSSFSLNSLCKNQTLFSCSSMTIVPHKLRT